MEMYDFTFYSPPPKKTELYASNETETSWHPRCHINWLQYRVGKKGEIQDSLKIQITDEGWPFPQLKLWVQKNETTVLSAATLKNPGGNSTKRGGTSGRRKINSHPWVQEAFRVLGGKTQECTSLEPPFLSLPHNVGVHLRCTPSSCLMRSLVINRLSA